MLISLVSFCCPFFCLLKSGNLPIAKVSTNLSQNLAHPNPKEAFEIERVH